MLNKTKIILAALLVSAALVPAWSAPVTKQVNSVDALATTGGVKTATFTVDILTIVGTPVVPPQINWLSIAPQSNQWVMSTSMIKLTWNVTDLSGGIQIYTDNKNASANPRFIDPTINISSNPDSNPAGMLMLTPPGITVSSATIPLAWAIKASSLTVADILPSDPETGPTTGPASRFQWFYMLDKQTPAIDRNNNNSLTDPVDTKAFANEDPYVIVAKHTGIHGSQGPGDFFPDPDHVSFIYFQADFTNAAAVTQYKTSHLTLEAYID